MIAYLEGTIIWKNDKQLIIRTGGVGYLVSTISDVIASTQVGDEIALYIYTAVREDDISLYGVTTPDALTFFKLLISVSGIGPRIALEILSTNVDRVKSAIVNEDKEYLCRLPGVGKKTAERIVLELKNKLGVLPDLGSATGLINQDVVEALVELGYQRFAITKLLAAMTEEITDTEELIRYCLRNL